MSTLDWISTFLFVAFVAFVVVMFRRDRHWTYWLETTEERYYRWSDGAWVKTIKKRWYRVHTDGRKEYLE